MGLQAPTGVEEDMVEAAMGVAMARHRVAEEVTVLQVEVDTAQVRMGGEDMVQVRTVGVDTVPAVVMVDPE